MHDNILSSLMIKGLWNEVDIRWKLDPKVNILIGRNGTGKSTVLKLINAALGEKEVDYERKFKTLQINFNNNKYIKVSKINRLTDAVNSKDTKKNNVYIKYFDFSKPIDESKPFKYYLTEENITNKDDKHNIKDWINISNINTFDLAINDLNYSNDSQHNTLKTDLDLMLDKLIDNFKSYLLKLRDREKEIAKSLDKKIEKIFIQNSLNKDEIDQLKFHLENKNLQIEKIYQQQQAFINIVNNFFSETGKTIDFDKNNSIIFNKNDKIIIASQLSSGEKQILIILLTIIQQENQATIILMDEPELSLHLSWQIELIKSIQVLNPNSQLIIATHSPSIFMKGWNDKVTKIEDISVSAIPS